MSSELGVGSRAELAARLRDDTATDVANIALFVPIGMFLLLLFGAGGWWLAAIASFAMTAFIESAQSQIPGRVSDGRDLIANTGGALIGIAIALILTLPATMRRRERKRYEHDRAAAWPR